MMSQTDSDYTTLFVSVCKHCKTLKYSTGSNMLLQAANKGLNMLVSMNTFVTSFVILLTFAYFFYFSYS